jgi:putative ABC transport system permease protein
MRQALRFWSRHWAQALWIVGSLGLAIGVATATWSVGYAVWLESLPVREPDRLVSIGYQDSNSPGRSTSFALRDLGTLNAQHDLFEGIAGSGSEYNMVGEDGWYLETGNGLVTLNAARVTTNFLDVLGTTPLVGRSFRNGDGESGAPEVAMISHRLWQSAFGASPDVIGRRVQISLASRSTRAVEIIGVLKPRVTIPLREAEMNFLVSPPADWQLGRSQISWSTRISSVVARLRPDVSLAIANARVSSLLHALDRESSAPVASVGGSLVPTRTRVRSASVLPLQQTWFGGSQQLLVLLATAAVLVVTVACTNALGVLLALAVRRSRELAVRSALGGSALRIRRMLIVELVPLAVAIAVVALLAARGLVAGFAAMAPTGLLRVADARVDWPAAFMAVGVAVTAMVAMGLIVAISQAGRRRLLPALQSGSAGATRNSFRSRRLLIAAQIGIALTLLTATGLVASSLWRLLKQPLGFDMRGVLSVGVTAIQPYFSEPGRYMQFIDAVQRQVQGAPGRREVAITRDPPLANSFGSIRVTSLDGTYRQVPTKPVSDGFFRVMGIPMLTGRDFTPADQTGCTTIVNALFARTFAGGVQQAAGTQVILGGAQCTIVAVVGDVRERGLAEDFTPMLYPRFSNRLALRETYLVTRESGSLVDATRNIREAIRRVDPTAVVTIQPLADRFSTQTAASRMGMTGLGALAGFTILLACLGIAATVAQVSAERRRELAIRSALGATARSLVVLMTRSIVSATAFGLFLGALLSWWLGPLVSRFLFQISAFNPLIWLGCAVSLSGVVALAAWLPARSIHSIDPADVLRQE